VPFELIDPVLPTRQIRLLGSSRLLSLLAGQLGGQLVDSFSRR
jgi:hypothetical protein